MKISFEQQCLLWLSSAEVTPGHLQKLLLQYESPQGIWEAFGHSQGPVFRDGTQKILQDLHSRSAMDDLCDQIGKKKVKLLFQSDPHYPELLGAIQDPPYLLYYAGNLSCLEMHMMAVVGTRQPSTYGMEMTAMIARGLSEAGVCVVSGLARGIDAAAHKATLEAGGHTVGIMGSGINVPYPPEHTELLRKMAGGIGLVISEYPLDALPQTYHFPHRNRIISGLSMGVVFVEGRIKSGGMHTVHAALAQGREVFAVPGQVGRYGSEGPLAILREGARIITSAQDLLDDLGMGNVPSAIPAEDSTVQLTIVQQSIVSCLEIQPGTPQEIAASCGMDVGSVIMELGALEILGVVSRKAGNCFYLPLSANK